MSRRNKKYISVRLRELESKYTELDLSYWKNRSVPYYAKQAANRNRYWWVQSLTLDDINTLIWSEFDEWPTRHPPDWAVRRVYAEVRAELMCEVCHRMAYTKNKEPSSVKFHTHHITHFSKGGTHALTNLRFMCARCHGKLPGHEFIRRLNRPVKKAGIREDCCKIYDHLECYEKYKYTPSNHRFSYWIPFVILGYGLATLDEQKEYILNPDWRTMLQQIEDQWIGPRPRIAYRDELVFPKITFNI